MASKMTAAEKIAFLTQKVSQLEMEMKAKDLQIAYLEGAVHNSNTMRNEYWAERNQVQLKNDELHKRVGELETELAKKKSKWELPVATLHEFIHIQAINNDLKNEIKEANEKIKRLTNEQLDLNVELANTAGDMKQARDLLRGLIKNAENAEKLLKVKQPDGFFMERVGTTSEPSTSSSSSETSKDSEQDSDEEDYEDEESEYEDEEESEYEDEDEEEEEKDEQDQKEEKELEEMLRVTEFFYRQSMGP